MKAVTVVSTRQFNAKAAELLSDDERADLEFTLAINPEAHPRIAELEASGKHDGAGQGWESGAAYELFTITWREPS